MFLYLDESFFGRHANPRAMSMGEVPIPAKAVPFGFSNRRSGGLMARSMMLPELGQLLHSTPLDSTRERYHAAIVDENVLGKPTYSSRRKSEAHLHQLYGLTPELALFRVLRRFAAEDAASLPLLALTCV